MAPIENETGQPTLRNGWSCLSLSPSLSFSRFIALYERCAYFGENRQAHDVEYNHA